MGYHKTTAGILVSVFVLAFVFVFARTLLVVFGGGGGRGGGDMVEKRYRYLLGSSEDGVRYVMGVNCIADGVGEKKRRLGSRTRLPLWAMVSTSFVLSIICYLLVPWPTTLNHIPSGGHAPSGNLTQSSLTNVFQVYQPPPATPRPAGDQCSIQLMDHDFGFSYGKPFVGSYTPPPCSPRFNTITITLTIASQGRQFDRLALMYLGDIEVFRTSTAEPTPNGIVWTYRKDMSAYLSLWREPQRLIFDLGNLVDEMYTGVFNATLTAEFWEVEEPIQAADLVLPISRRRGGVGEASAFSLPADDALVMQTLPRGVERAIVSIAACGQATEEFWYSNVLDRDTETFLNTTGQLYGFSPFREVQLLIDGYLAGVVWPFPIIFTGGIAPGFWRPVVGIDAFDLREPEIDITPWVPWLSDGQEHQFQIRVVGLDGGGGNVSLSSEVGDYWVVTGKILVFRGDEQTTTQNADGYALPSIFAPDPVISARSSTGQSANGANETLSYSVSASRSMVITSDTGSWVQNLEFQNNNLLTSNGLTQSTTQYTEAKFVAINFRNPRLSFSVASSYPLSVNTTIGMFGDSPGISIDASISRGLVIDSTGRFDESLFTLTSGGSKLDTSQFGTAHYSSQPNRSYSFGDTTQDFVENSRQGISIVHVETVNGSIAFTDGDGQDTFRSGVLGVAPIISEGGPLYRSLRDMVGRGPGTPVHSPP